MADDNGTTFIIAPDPRWYYRDVKRHFHKWTFAGKDRLSAKQSWKWCEAANAKGEWYGHCRECDEVIRPGGCVAAIPNVIPTGLEEWPGWVELKKILRVQPKYYRVALVNVTGGEYAFSGQAHPITHGEVAIDWEPPYLTDS